MPPRPLGLPDGERQKLRVQLIRHEGVRLKPYRDQGGTLTIGIGRNLDAVGISMIEARAMMDADIDRALVWISARHAEWFEPLDPTRQAAIVNMVYNLGPAKFMEFQKFIQCMRDRDYGRAAVEMLHSKWSQDVGSRALELAGIIRSGQWPPTP